MTLKKAGRGPESRSVSFVAERWIVGGKFVESEFLHSSFRLEELDYDAQLLAIRSLLFRQERADQELSERIGKVGKVAKQTSGIANDWAVDEWVGLVHDSCYGDAAHSMAAVGMIAPFIESIFPARLSKDLEQEDVQRKYHEAR